MKNVRLLLFLALVASCTPADEAVIRPGDDPLAGLIFDSYLADAKIAYTKRSDGFYVSDLSNLQQMEALIEKAYESINNTSRIQLETACIEQDVTGFLSEQGAIYELMNDDDRRMLRTTSATFDELDIASQISSAKRICDESEQSGGRQLLA